MAVTIGMIVASWICIMLYTMLYGDNPVSRTAEHIYTGILAAYELVVNLEFFWNKGVVQITRPGTAHYIIPVILGIMIYARLNESTRWLYRYPMAVLMGAMLGVTIRTTVFSQIIDQMIGNLPPIAPLTGVSAGVAVNNLIIIIGYLCAITFFIFSREFTGPERYVHRLGRLVILGGFGATYGNTVSYRYELMAGTFISNLLQPPEILPYTFGFALAIAIVLVFAFRSGYASWD
jgi:hypothetical protein